MRADWKGTPVRSATRDVSVLYYPTATWPEILLSRKVALPWSSTRPYVVGDLSVGPTDGADYYSKTAHKGSTPESSPTDWRAALEADFVLETPVDLSAYVVSASHTARQFEARLVSHGALTVPSGSILVVRDNVTSQTLWTGVVENVSASTNRRGDRSTTIRARSRDEGPLWRSTQWSSDVYPVGTDIAEIVRDVVEGLGLLSAEFPALQPFGRYTPHTSTQLGDMAAWEMLETALFPVLLEPWVDALGRFKPISRDVRRFEDSDVLDVDVVAINKSISDPVTSAVVIEWLDRNLSRSSQQSQVLATESITAGFFKSRHRRRVYWSKDRYQRAENTSMKVVASVNDGLLPVGDESYEQIDEYHGRITVETSAWVPTVATISMATYLVLAAIPDEVVTTQGFGHTIPVGRIIQAGAAIVLWLIVMSLGTGTYEIHGEPFDFVHALNKTEAYVDGVPQWARSELVLRSDLVVDEAHAQEVANAELLYRYLAATSTDAEVVDDPRIEPGDIVRLDGQTRLYVLDYRRDLARGSENVLQVQGFRV